MQKVVVIGGGGHAKVVIDSLQNMNVYEIVGFTSAFGDQESLCGVKNIGDDTVIQTLVGQEVTGFIIAIGSNELRKKLFNKCLSSGLHPINAIHPTATISPYASIGKGVMVAASAVINPYAIISDNAIINTNASVDHDCIIDSHVHIAPGVTLTGSVRVKEGAFLGAKCTVVPQKSIGEWAKVGAGATVLQDVAPYSTVVGTPAKIIKQKDDI
ncbi:acetyltransferase [Paenibacillus spiritus]|uniref:Acetyltransferase n=1 Tax=Paenibacillus spiritus TaxID=2496557 RepID=A0A5J5FT20_9BACL|nr:acetyltransferase [Paenibacillus spiritus]KAA8996591.1 acetyltransferase [Paenibacillus spiritus]